MTLFLVEFELEIVSVHDLRLQDLESGPQITVDIRALVAVFGNHTCQLPGALGASLTLVLVFV